MNKINYTIESQLVTTNGRPSGFDYIRIILALSVVFFHSIKTSYGYEADQAATKSGWHFLIESILPMFFALSGFLVAGSLERSKSLITFLGLRILRIIPALSAEVLLSALILGPLLTTVSLNEYFHSQLFHNYFLNIVGDIHYELPGLFLSNPYPKVVNNQLWTIPYELECYVLLTVLAVIGIFKRRKLLVYFILLAYMAQCFKMLWEMHYHNVVYVGGVMSGHAMVMMFMAGVIIYRFRERIPFNGALFAASAILSALLLAWPINGDRFVSIPLAYFTIYLGLLNPRRNQIILGGDYSYGIYLYGFALQQAFSALLPALREWYWNIIFVTPITVLVAYCSWHCIEIHALKLKKYLKMFEVKYLLKFGKAVLPA